MMFLHLQQVKTDPINYSKHNIFNMTAKDRYVLNEC